MGSSPIRGKDKGFTTSLALKVKIVWRVWGEKLWIKTLGLSFAQHFLFIHQRENTMRNVRRVMLPAETRNAIWAIGGMVYAAASKAVFSGFESQIAHQKEKI